MRKKDKREPKDGVRVITKYPNRRLYDTVLARYICISDIVSMVRDQIVFKVVRYTTGDDITRTVLFDSLREAEMTRSVPVLGVQDIAEMIRSDRPVYEVKR